MRSVAVISHIFQLERHKNIENYVFRYMFFLYENLPSEEFKDHFFFSSYIEQEDLKGSLISRLESIGFPMDKVAFFRNHYAMMQTLKVSNFDNNIFHQLSSKRIYLFLLCNKELCKKSSWVIWGGDLYNYFISRMSIKHKIFNFWVKKNVIKHLRLIIGIESDFNVLKSKYTTTAEYALALYPPPSKVYCLNEFTKSVKCDSNNKVKKILVAHSANKTNNHQKIFKSLLPYRSQNIEILCPLSYGDLENTSCVEKLGYSLFGGKFKPLKRFMDPGEFSRLLSGLDVAVFAADRQVAVGIITTLISLGKKIYYKKEVSPYSFYEANNIKLFDAKLVGHESFEGFIEMSPEDKLANIKNINAIYEPNNIVSMWRSVFAK